MCNCIRRNSSWLRENARKPQDQRAPSWESGLAFRPRAPSQHTESIRARARGGAVGSGLETHFSGRGGVNLWCEQLQERLGRMLWSWAPTFDVVMVTEAASLQTEGQRSWAVELSPHKQELLVNLHDPWTFPRAVTFIILFCPKSLTHSFINSTNLLIACCMPDSMLSTGDMIVNKRQTWSLMSWSL